MGSKCRHILLKDPDHIVIVITSAFARLYLSIDENDSPEETFLEIKSA